MYEEFIPNIKLHEGSILHMYLDTRGYVTVGVGQLLADVDAAKAMPFIHRDSGTPATGSEIEEEYQRVKSQELGKAASYYQQFTQLELTDNSIDNILMGRVDEFMSGLQREFAGFDNYPAAAKEALLDMAFNLGLSGLVNKFPKLKSAAEQNDWASCAAECERRGIGDARNEFTRKLFEQA